MTEDWREPLQILALDLQSPTIGFVQPLQQQVAGIVQTAVNTTNFLWAHWMHQVHSTE